MSFDSARVGFPGPRMDDLGFVYDATEDKIKMACNEIFGGIVIPSELLSKSPTLAQDEYIFTSDFCVFSTRNEEPLSLSELMSLKEPFFAFGQPPGYGINNYNFVIYFADKDRVFMLNIPYGGAYMDDGSGKERINEAFQKLAEFVSTPSNAKSGSKLGLFYKSELGGFSPIFNVDRKTLDFREVKKK